MRPALLLAAAVLTGCATANPITTYPDFPDRYAASEGTRLIADVMITDDVSGRTDQVTIDPNVALGQGITDSLTVWLGARGYAVDRAYPAAVGLYYVPADARHHVREDHGAPADSSQAGPYVVAPEVAADTLMVTALTALGSPSSLPEPAVGAYETLVTVVVRGRRVPFGKSLLQGIVSGVVSGLLTGGLVSASVYEQSHTAVELALVDAATGEVIWRDVSVATGAARERDVWKAVRWMVGRLPERSAVGV